MIGQKQNSGIVELLRCRGQEAPQSAALCAPGRLPLTYGGLVDHIENTAAFLMSSGIRSGDRIVAALPNGPELASGFLSIASIAVCAPIYSACTQEQFDTYLRDLDARAVVLQPETAPAAVAAAAKRGLPVIEFIPEPAKPAGTFLWKVTGHLGLRHESSPPTDQALILPTSGTTSRPKFVPLTHRNLLTSAANVAASLQLTQGDRCLNVMPLFHVHGLIGALLSSLAVGASVVCTPGFDHEQFMSWLETFRPTWYTAVPTIHDAVLRSAAMGGGQGRNHSLRFIRSCSSPLPARLMHGLEESFKVPVIEAYGMTEAAHQITSNPLPPGQRKPGSVGIPGQTAVSIVNGGGDFVATGELGEIVVRGANVTAGYLDAKANEAGFHREWLKTGDQGYIDQDGYLFISGRLKEMINRGGEKIAPREVEEAILRHPAVAEAIVFGMAHETLGEEVAAAVVICGGADVSESALQRLVASQLSEFKVPKRIIVVDEIPKSASGKPQRAGLAEKFAPLLVRSSIEEITPARSQIEELLAGIWAEVLHIKRPKVKENFFLLGGDSIRAAQVVARVRGIFGIELPLRWLFEYPTIREVASLLEGFHKESASVNAQRDTSPNSQLMTEEQEDGRTRRQYDLQSRREP